MASQVQNAAGVGTTPVTVTFTSPPREVWIKNTGGNDVLLNVPAVHNDATSFEVLEAGDTAKFRQAGGIANYTHKTASGTTSFDQGIIEF